MLPFSKGSRKKIRSFLLARPLRGGGEVRALPLRKNAVFEALTKILENKALVAGPLKKDLVCGFPNPIIKKWPS